ncbi:hypothetical protein PUNSTDRAFT_138870 [Punctularia strigosozonata HHB-11173 SS5]|uniref:Secreted protein n=1 Tax=Punctularia strigosozonata (strain HHB-11173) TaxID=741275 RepID=R7S2X0_PUNST|nr:uncharacterized protein PUNSTDRAFT_138870 [Punctularia strigosozonata HHB-11173 SS5]EIN04142.1 hypothetical protein PUNSTDRAFT_138870 [Punctularia strigosozonata HHB-11173 SS5]
MCCGHRVALTAFFLYLIPQGHVQISPKGTVLSLKRQTYDQVFVPILAEKTLLLAAIKKLGARRSSKEADDDEEDI